jgi:hypothetical protein
MKITKEGPLIIAPDYKEPTSSPLGLKIERGDLIYATESCDITGTKAKVGEVFKVTEKGPTKITK